MRHEGRRGPPWQRSRLLVRRRRDLGGDREELWGDVQLTRVRVGRVVGRGVPGRRTARVVVAGEQLQMVQREVRALLEDPERGLEHGGRRRAETGPVVSCASAAVAPRTGDPRRPGSASREGPSR